MPPETALFTAALGLTPPWQVTEVKFDKESKELHLYVDFPRGSTFSCPECGRQRQAYDTRPGQT